MSECWGFEQTRLPLQRHVRNVVGLPVVRLAVAGVDDGPPGVAVGPAVMKLQGPLWILPWWGFPGVAVGPAVMGAPVEGRAVLPWWGFLRRYLLLLEFPMGFLESQWGQP